MGLGGAGRRLLGEGLHLRPPLTLGGAGRGPEGAGPRPKWEQAHRPRTRAWPTLRMLRTWGAHLDSGPRGAGWPAGDEGAPLLRAPELGWGWTSGARSPQPTPAGCPTPTSCPPPSWAFWIPSGVTAVRLGHNEAGRGQWVTSSGPDVQKSPDKAGQHAKI